MHKSLSSRCPGKFANYKSVIVLFSQSVCVCPSPFTPVYKPNPFLLNSFSFRHRHHSLFRQKGNRHVAMDLWRHYRRLWDPTQPDGGRKEKEKEFHSLGRSVRNPDENTNTSNTDIYVAQFPNVFAAFSVLVTVYLCTLKYAFTN